MLFKQCLILAETYHCSHLLISRSSQSFMYTAIKVLWEEVSRGESKPIYGAGSSPGGADGTARCKGCAWQCLLSGWHFKLYRCTTVSLQRASKGFKACQGKIFGSLVLGPSALLMTKGRDRLPVNTSDRYGSQFTICCLGPEV